MSFLETLSLMGQKLAADAVFGIPVPTIPTVSNPCGVATGLPCGTGGAAGVSNYVVTMIIPAMEYIFLAIAILMFFYYGVRLMLESEEDSTVNDTKSAITYGVSGAVVVSIAGLIVQAVGPGFASGTIVNAGPVATALDSIVFFMRLMVSAAVSAVIVYQGFRLIVLQGDDSEAEQTKKRFFNGLIGVAVVTLANFIIEGFLPTNGTGVLSTQIIGIANYLLEIFGALCVLAFLVAGFMLVISTDEGLKDRAKKAMFTTAIAIIIVLCCFVIVNFVIGISSVGS
jgi:hypothetical protein